ncbi:MAG: NTP transferase domain-containing protein [Micromonosporaceae bacterium]|nr:NTP transferase domain-containing protein [Micromonosporaceae bacterium]
MRGSGWALVVPVKWLAEAKSRLRGAPVGVPHAALVLAMAQDTVRAALVCPVVVEVLVVTDDPEVTAALGGLGARVVADAPAAGLNAALEHGAAVVAGTATGGRRPVAALAADLPALRPAELAGALRAAELAGAPRAAELAGAPRAAAAPGGRGFVPDRSGTGTTLLAALEGVPLDPRFGPDSAARHAASGARRLTGRWPSVRRDVDTVADLVAAARLGLGPATAGLWRETAR